MHLLMCTKKVSDAVGALFQVSDAPENPLQYKALSRYCTDCTDCIAVFKELYGIYKIGVYRKSAMQSVHRCTCPFSHGVQDGIEWHAIM